MSRTTELVVAPAVPTGSSGGARLGPLARWPVAMAVFVAVLGLLVQTVGYALGWSDHEAQGLVLWYVGIVLVVCPFAALLLVPLTGHQRLGSSLAFGLVMYASWLLSNPVMATRFDESLHVTTLVNLVHGGGFFATNSMLPVSPHYPGLELAASGVYWLTGLPLMVCQILVVLVARSTFVLALFLLASRIGRSTRVGAVAVMIYAGSAQFYFFNSQFSYQTVAIAMLMASMYLLVRAFDSAQERPWGPLLAVQVCLAALTVTHHLTSWLVLGAIWAMTALFYLGGETRRFRLTLITAELATIVTAAWTALIAPLLVSYLGPVFEGAGAEVTKLIALDGGGRTVGSGSSGLPTPKWELAVMAASILLWVLLLMLSTWRAWRGSTIGRSRARYLPLALAASYPLLQLARFSPTAGEIGDRASTFITMATALVVGTWLVPRLPRLRRLVVPGALLLVLGGTMLGGGPDWQRMTGPYLPGAEQRSVDSTMVATAQWAGRYLPAGSRIASDVTVDRVLPNFAPVVPVTSSIGLANVTPLFIYTGFDDTSIRLIQDNAIDFVIVDTRIIGRTVFSGCYWEGSCGYGPESMTPDVQQLGKFDGQEGFDLVLDGPIKVYDVRSLRGALPTFADRADPGLPGSWTPWQVGLTAALALIALATRGRLLDPRRFRSRDMWRPAVVLPAAMLVGAVGVLSRFTPWVGSVLLVALLAGWLLRTPRPAPYAVPVPVGVRAWMLVTGLVLVVAFVIASVAAWHGELDAPALPPPAAAASR